MNTYTIHISRTGASDDASLATLTENLADTIWPSFKPNLMGYSLRAKEGENRVTIKATPKHAKARLIIDGADFSGTSGYEKILIKGLNTISIVVVAENGASVKYIVEIQKPI